MSLVRVSSPNALELRGISKTFGKNLALDSLSFSVPRGSVCGLVGENGAAGDVTGTVRHRRHRRLPASHPTRRNRRGARRLLHRRQRGQWNAQRLRRPPLSRAVVGEQRQFTVYDGSGYVPVTAEVTGNGQIDILLSYTVNQYGAVAYVKDSPTGANLAPSGARLRRGRSS